MEWCTSRYNDDYDCTLKVNHEGLHEYTISWSDDEAMKHIDDLPGPFNRLVTVTLESTIFGRIGKNG